MEKDFPYEKITGVLWKRYVSRFARYRSGLPLSLTAP
jgi:hypothetical protein